MKKILCFIAFAAALCACDKMNSRYLTQFTPFVADLSVKSSLDAETGIVSWSEGDRIKVYNGKQESIFEYDPESGLFKTGDNFERTGEYQAVYPAEIASLDGSNYRIDIKDEQTASLGKVDKLPLYLWRVRDDVFKFKSIGGVAKLQLGGSGVALYEAPLTKVVFTSTGNPVAGQARLVKDGIEFDSGVQTLTVNCPEGFTVTTPVYMFLPAHKYPMGSNVEFHFSDGKVINSETIMGIVPQSGMVKSYGIEITADFFGPIEEYGDGGSIDGKY